MDAERSNASLHLGGCNARRSNRCCPFICGQVTFTRLPAQGGVGAISFAGVVTRLREQPSPGMVSFNISHELGGFADRGFYVHVRSGCFLNSFARRTHAGPRYCVR